MIKYQGKNVTQQLAAFLKSFSYTDAPPGEQDKITFDIDDRERKWIREWKPVLGDKIVTEVNIINWDKAGAKSKIKCGSFELESVDYSMPNSLGLVATAIPKGGAPAIREKRSKGWEKIKLRAIAQEIANRARLKLSYNVKINPTYDRLDQSEETDLNFLTKICSDEGLAIKVTTGSLILFDEAEFEKSAPVATLEYGKSNIIDYGFSISDSDTAYASCVVTYKPTASTAKKKKAKDKKKGKKGKTKPNIPLDPDLPPPPKTFMLAAAAPAKEKKPIGPITGSYTIPGVTGPVLRIDQKVDSIAEAQRVAKNKLREKNKGAGLASFVLDGNPEIASGVTVTVKGFGIFDGKYLVLSVDHSIAGGAFTSTISIRKVLGWS